MVQSSYRMEWCLKQNPQEKENWRDVAADNEKDASEKAVDEIYDFIVRNYGILSYMHKWVSTLKDDIIIDNVRLEEF